jgi:hypothetical protein
MKAMFRRLRRIETQLAPEPNAAAQRAVELLRERRRRRLEAAGQPFEELPSHTVTAPGPRLSIEQTLRLRRQMAHESAPQPQE